MSTFDPFDHWPPLEDADLLARLAVSDHCLGALQGSAFARMPAPLHGADVDERLAIGRAYPFARAAGVTRVGDPGAGDGEPRYPVLAIGANASPGRMADKFQAQGLGAFRIVPAVLHDHDVCAGPYPTSYGAFPAELTPAPGTVVDVAVAYVTAGQLEWLSFTEFAYRLGRLGPVAIETAEGEGLRDVYAYSHRAGRYDVEGAPVALAAVPARGRRLDALDQRQIADHAARRLGLGDRAGEALLRTMMGEPDTYRATLLPRLLALARRDALPGFTPHPAGLPAPG